MSTRPIKFVFKGSGQDSVFVEVEDEQGNSLSPEAFGGVVTSEDAEGFWSITLSAAPEPDVEYGCRRAYDDFVFGPFSKLDAMNFQGGFDTAEVGSKLVQRTAPGPWTAVTE